MNKFDSADNPNTPPEVLEQLATFKSSLVCYRDARNPNTPLDVLEKLVNHDIWLVRYGVTLNHKIPKYIKTYSRYQIYLKSYG